MYPEDVIEILTIAPALPMIDFLIRLLESELDASMDYLRTVADGSRAAFWKFMLFLPLAQHRQSLPPGARAVAELVSTRAEDCGTCVQIGVDQARRHGVDRATVEAVLEDRPPALPDELGVVYEYVRAVVGRDDETAERLRPRLLERFGREGLVEIALTVGTARVFPVVKRAIGHGTACRLVELQWEDRTLQSARPLETSDLR